MSRGSGASEAGQNECARVAQPAGGIQFTPFKRRTHAVTRHRGRASFRNSAANYRQDVAAGPVKFRAANSDGSRRGIIIIDVSSGSRSTQVVAGQTHSLSSLYPSIYHWRVHRLLRFLLNGIRRLARRYISRELNFITKTRDVRAGARSPLCLTASIPLMESPRVS